MTEKLHGFVEKLKENMPDTVVDVVDAFGEVTMIVDRNSIVGVCEFFRDQSQFDMLADLCGADRGPEDDPRFEVNYHLFSTVHYQRLRLKVLLSEDDARCSNSDEPLENGRLARTRDFDLLA